MLGREKLTGKKFKNTVAVVPGFGDSPKLPWWTVFKGYLEKEDPEINILEVDFSATIHPPFFHGEEIKVPFTSVGSLKDYALQLKERVSEVEGKVDILAHSMGGLVSRWYIEVLEGDEKVDSLITLATPHQGTASAYIGFITPAGREMVPGSEVLQTLNTGELPEDVEYTAVYGSEDHVFFKSWRAKLPENFVVNNSKARNIFVGPVDHHEMVVNKNVFEEYKKHFTYQ